jgi:hypothetical protein
VRVRFPSPVTADCSSLQVRFRVYPSGYPWCASPRRTPVWTYRASGTTIPAGNCQNHTVEGVLCRTPGQAEVYRLDAMNRSRESRRFPLAAVLVGFLAGVGAVAGAGAGLDQRPKVFQVLALAIAGVAAGGAAAMALIISRDPTKGSKRIANGSTRPPIYIAKPAVGSKPAVRPIPTFRAPAASLQPRASSRRGSSKKNPQFYLPGLIF